MEKLPGEISPHTQALLLAGPKEKGQNILLFLHWDPETPGMTSPMQGMLLLIPCLRWKAFGGRKRKKPHNVIARLKRNGRQG